MLVLCTIVKPHELKKNEIEMNEKKFMIIKLNRHTKIRMASSAV